MKWQDNSAARTSIHPRRHSLMQNWHKEPPPFIRQASIFVGSMYIALGFGPLYFFAQMYSGKKVGLFGLMPATLQDSLSTAFSRDVIGEQSQKDKLSERVRQDARLYATLETWRLVTTQILTILGYVLFFVLLIGFMKWLRHYHGEFPDLSRLARVRSYKLLFFAFFPGFIIKAFAEYSVRRFSPRQNFAHAVARLNLARRFAQWWPTVFGVGLLVWWAVLRNFAERGGLTISQKADSIALMFGLIVIFAFLISSLVRRVINYILDRARNYYADSLITVQLVMLAGFLNQSSSIPESVRRFLSIANLEIVSRLFEHALPKQIIGNTPGSGSLREKMAQIGNGVRDLKTRVAIPRSETWDVELLKHVSGILLNFMSFNWAALPTAKKKEPARQTALERTKSITRWLIAAATPGILFGLLQLTPLQLTGQRAEIVLLITLAWFALSILLRLDPEFSAKTKTLKEVQDITTFGMKH